MNTKGLAKNYQLLTPEERFCLILAAGARDDEAEQDRLAQASQRINLAMPDHAPYGHAFAELSHLTFIELLEEAAAYFDELRQSEDMKELFGEDDEDKDEGEEVKQEAVGTDVNVDETDGGGGDEDERRKRPFWQRHLDMFLARGFMLRVKSDGWKLFCDRLNIPSDVLWQEFPGIDRLNRALALTEKAAFQPDGMVRWLNAIRPKGRPKCTECRWNVEGVADANEKAFRQRARWWGG